MYIYSDQLNANKYAPNWFPFVTQQEEWPTGPWLIFHCLVGKSKLGRENERSGVVVVKERYQDAIISHVL